MPWKKIPFYVLCIGAYANHGVLACTEFVEHRWDVGAGSLCAWRAWVCPILTSLCAPCTHGPAPDEMLCVASIVPHSCGFALAMRPVTC